MFMFRGRRSAHSKRSAHSRRLVKAHKRQADETATETLRQPLEELFEKLQDKQLEMLTNAVEARGLESSGCVLLPADGQPHVLCCQAWRWPKLRHASELKRLPCCQSACDPVYVCCNPYHWSRYCRQPESPPPPYSKKPEDRAPSEAALVHRDAYTGSLTTSGEGPTNGQLGWCQLAYWEMGKRVGPLYPVDQPALNVFGNVPHGDGISLHTLAQNNHSPPEVVCRTRNKIGLGVTLSREDDCVWVYNKSEHPIFINSPTLDDSDLSAPTRVPAEHCLCVYDPVKAAHQNYGWNFTGHFGPIDRRSVRISFVKGWGPGYTRQEITSCSCWLEILLAPCR